jgi:hypothetical protein
MMIATARALPTRHHRAYSLYDLPQRVLWERIAEEEQRKRFCSAVPTPSRCLSCRMPLACRKRPATFMDQGPKAREKIRCMGRRNGETFLIFLQIRDIPPPRIVKCSCLRDGIALRRLRFTSQRQSNRRLAAKRHRIHEKVARRGQIDKFPIVARRTVLLVPANLSTRALPSSPPGLSPDLT